MKIFMLNVSRCKNQPLEYDKPIPCVLGVYGCDLDVMERRITSESIKIWREDAKPWYEKGTLETPTYANKPLGIDLRNLPVGATLTVTEEDYVEGDGTH